MSQPQNRSSNNRTGMLYMTASCAIFAAQDGISRHLAENISVYMIVMVRFWVFGALALAWAARTSGGFRAAITSAYPGLQFLRALIMIAEICVIMFSFVKLGLIATHAVFICYPLIIAALSVPILGEKVGWRRWLAIFVGFIGVLVIINPGSGVLSFWTLVPLAAALMFAVYSVLTRYVAQGDSASVSFFWTGVLGAILITPFGIMHWGPVSGEEAIWLGALCVLAIAGHWMLIKAYDTADASSIQPFAYLQFPFVSIVGLLVFSEALSVNVIVGAAIVVGAGLFTLWRERVRRLAALKS
ncbi:DMT family transporter [Aquamicrobium zhengzhouense]|nr:DMT family transporter [Aquamicrobium zhengzhouense]